MIVSTVRCKHRKENCLQKLFNPCKKMYIARQQTIRLEISILRKELNPLSKNRSLIDAQ